MAGDVLQRWTQDGHATRLPHRSIFDHLAEQWQATVSADASLLERALADAGCTLAAAFDRLAKVRAPSARAIGAIARSTQASTVNDDDDADQWLARVAAEALTGYRAADRDKLWTAALLHRRLFEPLTAICAENTGTRPCRFALVEPASADTLLKIPSDTAIEWVVLSSRTDDLKPDLLERHDVRVEQCDVRVDAAPDSCINHDAAVLDKVLHRVADMEQFMEKVKTVI